MIYTIHNFNEILFNGFDIKLSEDTIKMISNLTLEVGSPTYIKTPIFNKKEFPKTDAFPVFHAEYNGRKKRNKMSPLNNDEWEQICNYKPIKIEKKEGVAAEIDLIRSYLNKMTEKNYDEIKEHILKILKNVNDPNVIKEMGENIFHIASTNRFYSQNYANLYTVLMDEYKPMEAIFTNSFDKFLDLFNNIEYVDSVANYDKFCEINQTNERRRALSCFFINLMINGVVKKSQIMKIIQTLLIQLNAFIREENRTNEVNEIGENVGLLFNKKFFVESDYENIKINDKNLLEYLVSIANSKSKNFKSLSAKTIFKFMDMMDM